MVKPPQIPRTWYHSNSNQQEPQNKGADMGDSTANQLGQGTIRRAFLKQVLAINGVSAGAALLHACGSASATATAVPPVAQQPTALPSNLPAPTTAAMAGTVATPSSGAAPTGAATAGATAP